MAVYRRVGQVSALGGEGFSGKKEATQSCTLPSLQGWGNAALLVSNWFRNTLASPRVSEQPSSCWGNNDSKQGECG